MLNRRIALVGVLALAGCTRRNSLAANAKLIQLRMTEARVEAILGAPSSSMLGASDQDMHDLTYESGGDVIPRPVPEKPRLHRRRRAEPQRQADFEQQQQVAGVSSTL